MEISAIMLLIGLLLLIVLFLADPFSRGGQFEASSQNQDISSLLAEQERVLSALEELDTDYRLGKVPEEDYPQQRAALLQAGTEILRRLDELKASASSASAEDRLEAAIAERRGRVAAVSSDDDLESLISRRRAERKGKVGGFCPQCGRPVLKDDRFCPHCGYALK